MSPPGPVRFLASGRALGVAALFGGITLTFLGLLVILSVLGREIPCNSRYLVTAFIAFGSALAAAFIGGNASANGNLNIPGGNKPLAVSVGGGVAVLVIMVVLQSFFYSERGCDGARPIDGGGVTPPEVEEVAFSPDDALDIAVLIPDPEKRISTYEKLCGCTTTATFRAMLTSFEITAEPSAEVVSVVEQIDAAPTPQIAREALANSDYQSAACGGEFQFVVGVDGILSCANGMPIPFVASPHHGEKEIEPLAIMLHSTITSGVDPTLGAFLGAQPVSTHLLVSRSGAVVQLVPLNRAAFHAGAGSFENLRNLNSNSIGISLINVGALTEIDGQYVFGASDSPVPLNEIALVPGTPPPSVFERYTDAQVDVTVNLVKAINASSPRSLPTIRHSDTTTLRTDPGPAFPYQDFCERVACPDSLKSPSQVDGYIYYETDENALPTSDGVYVPALGGYAPLQDIHKGMFLTATSTSRLRELATKNSALVTQIEAGQCVLVTGLKENPHENGRGAWFSVMLSPCPSKA
jgi:N-acetylmuramoyl-L-alanine amidase